MAFPSAKKFIISNGTTLAKVKAININEYAPYKINKGATSKNFFELIKFMGVIIDKTSMPNIL